MDTSTTDSQALPPGTHLHEFVIERVLGAGGFGITYLARDVSLNRQVVIKENLPTQFAWRETATGTVRPRHTSGGDADDYEWSMKNFLREAETLASLDHPGIVRVLRKFETNGTAYFVMPFVEGVPFDGLIAQRQQKNQQFSEEELRGLLERMLDALGYLHDRGIYHRDIKPGNILISNNGVPALIDFGSARQRLSERSMTVIESAGYTPFEQLQSRGNVGPWSDLYALGGTLCKALTGEAPPKANDRAFDDPFIPLADRQELAGCYSPAFLMSIDKALASRVVDRWQNSGEWLVSLGVRSNRIQIDPGRAPGSAQPQESQASVAKNQSPPKRTLIWGLAACLVVATLLFFGRNVSNQHKAEREKIVRENTERDQEQERTRLLEEERQAVSDAMTALNIRKQPSELSEDEAKVVGYYRDSLEKASGEAMFNLGVCYANGTGVAKDEVEGVKWYRKAAEAGDARGMFNLGVCYANGTGVAKDEVEAVKWYRKAAEAGDAIGMSNLGFCYTNGTGVAKDEVEAVKWYRKAAEAGDAWGMAILGVCYDNGKGVAKDEVEAVKWYRRAAEAGDARGMNNLGVCYANGTGVAKDEVEAVKWYRRAAEAGDARGMASLGDCYDNGTGVAKDEVEAVKWYRKAAEAGDACGMNNLGVCYKDGTGVVKDEAEAVKWYRKAAETGHASGMINLGSCYFNGTGVAKDEVEAVKWYRKTADAGDADGMINLGVCYEYGTGVVKDEAEAVKWYRKAAEAGYARGMFNLGFCYANGTGVAKDEVEAVKWYRKAAEAGDAIGMSSLGFCYDNGTGVAKDEVEAVKWYRKALDAGNEQVAKFAGESLKRLGK
jgi:TPR repeat protein